MSDDPRRNVPEDDDDFDEEGPDYDASDEEDEDKAP